ncbi:hypothetical protein [Blautia sp. MSJ-19]|uniref:hypothetical protein n=1 Tax=Blautia sp. MSJ-19 TaxID=2841517 RepID=UPI001C0EE3AF|nr:hypothetical protein [Blautia sp. MSJ-19]MBU5481886.1 hypothetical protein [Blautia sp. MSJ-19]
MTYSIFHILKQYQEKSSCQLEEITLEELEAFASRTRKEENGYDILRSHHSSYGSNGSW